MDGRFLDAADFQGSRIAALHLAVRGKFKDAVDLLSAWRPKQGDETIIDVGVRWSTPLHLAKRGMNVPIMEALIRFIDTNWPEAVNLILTLLCFYSPFIFYIEFMLNGWCVKVTDNIKEPLVDTKLVKNARHWLNDRYECDSLVDT
ncbi:unnamed protein product [Sphagnum jensenii]|uniref:Ankyrin repeat-containing protein n=1 Tax=Sphagnum jensenii TaxID=128206 RepID=A0ABP1B1H6_9BRYO